MTTERDIQFLIGVGMAYAELPQADSDSTTAWIECVRGMLTYRGLSAPCRVGETEMSAIEQVEWAAGQIVDAADNRAWDWLLTFGVELLGRSLDRVQEEGCVSV